MATQTQKRPPNTQRPGPHHGEANTQPAYLEICAPACVAKSPATVPKSMDKTSSVLTGQRGKPPPHRVTAVGERTSAPTVHPRATKLTGPGSGCTIPAPPACNHSDMGNQCPGNLCRPGEGLAKCHAPATAVPMGAMTSSQSLHIQGNEGA